VLKTFGVSPVFWLGEVIWARSAVIMVSVWIGAPFFRVMYLAALKSVPEQLYEAAEIDGATWWQKHRFVTLPMTRNIIAITMLFSLIVSSGAFKVSQILTKRGPHNQTDTLATWAFGVGMMGGDIPLGAPISLFTLPILALAAFFHPAQCQGAGERGVASTAASPRAERSHRIEPDRSGCDQHR